MQNSHRLVLKEITDTLELSMISGGASGSGDWGTGAQIVWSAVVGIVSGKSCSWPGGFYSPGNPAPSGSGVCTGGKPADFPSEAWNYGAGRMCNWDPFNDNDICY